MSEASPQRRAYCKPQLRTIELVAEEVLSIGCKMVNGGISVGSGGVGSGCALNGCTSIGS